MNALILSFAYLHKLDLKHLALGTVSLAYSHLHYPGRLPGSLRPEITYQKSR